MHERSSCGVAKECLCNGCPSLLVGFTTLYLGCVTLGAVRAFELVITRGLSEQLLDVGRRVIRRGCVDPNDAAIAVELVTGPQFQTRDAVGVNAHQMQPIGRHLQRELLHRFAVTAVKQRRLTSLLRQEVRRGDG
ncbi:MAG: hypothetical protein DMF93_23490 [Acidobacteria bacterium]|nr:MAG: hypothetical protein DMF93_23490 [Acidobacteriota bacterium]